MRYTTKIAKPESFLTTRGYKDLRMNLVDIMYAHYWSEVDIKTLKNRSFTVLVYSSNKLQIGYLHSLDLVDLVYNI